MVSMSETLAQPVYKSQVILDTRDRGSQVPGKQRTES